jgi:hypothetical protein
MVTLQKAAPRWLNLMNRPTPPAPPPAGDNPIEDALDGYKTLRGNYANVCGQLAEAHDLLRELAHQNEALEKTITEDRAYYQREIERRDSDLAELLIYRTQIRTRLATIVEVILAADRAAREVATAPPETTTPHTQEADQEPGPEAYAPRPIGQPFRRSVPRMVETDAEAAEVRRVTEGIIAAGGGTAEEPPKHRTAPPPINAY